MALFLIFPADRNSIRKGRIWTNSGYVAHYLYLHLNQLYNEDYCSKKEEEKSYGLQ